MKQIVFTRHAQMQMEERGVSAEEIVSSIKDGESMPALYGRKAFRKNFAYQDTWGGKFYGTKQVIPIVAEEEDKMIVITVYSFYF